MRCGIPASAIRPGSATPTATPSSSTTVTRPMGRADGRLIDALQRHPSVRGVRLVGSRAEGRAREESDWDFLVESDDFALLADDLPALCRPFEPLAQQWDRLSS